MGEGRDDLALHWNPVVIDFAVERLTYSDGVVMPVGRGIFAFGPVEPELNAIEEMEPSPVNDWSGLSLVIGSEENCGAEEPLEAVDEAAVVRAVFGKMEEVEHLGGGIEMKFAGFLPQRERRYPDGDETVLAEREPKIRMSDDVEKESAIAPAM